MVDDPGEFGAAPNEIAGCELALEHGILEVIAVVPHGFEDAAETFFV
jgi:hypothetical protein